MNTLQKLILAARSYNRMAGDRLSAEQLQAELREANLRIAELYAEADDSVLPMPGKNQPSPQLENYSADR